MSNGHNYYARQSDKACKGDPIRKMTAFRLHPDRLADLDAVARKWNMTKARALETMIQSAASVEQRPTIDDRYRRLKEKEAASIEQAQP